MQGHTVTSHRSGVQSDAQINHLLHNMEPDGMAGFEREWAHYNQGRLSAQPHMASARFGMPSMIDISAGSRHAWRAGGR